MTLPFALFSLPTITTLFPVIDFSRFFALLGTCLLLFQMTECRDGGVGWGGALKTIIVKLEYADCRFVCRGGGGAWGVVVQLQGFTMS